MGKEQAKEIKVINKQRIILGILFWILALAILFCFYMEIFQKRLLSKGYVSGMYVDGSFDPSNTKINNRPSYHFSAFNIFAYFTQLSNLLVAIWAILYGVALLFNITKLKDFCEKPIICTAITTYVTIAGLAVAGVMILGIVKFQPWQSVWTVIVNLISIIYHFVVPITMLLFCWLKDNNKKMSLKMTPWVLLFPLIYSIWTIIRGLFIHPGYYPYFVFSPRNIWAIIAGSAEYNVVLAYVAMVAILAVGALLFWLVARLVTRLLNKPGSIKI